MRIRSIEHASLLIASIVTAFVIVCGSILVAIYGFAWWGLLIICFAELIISFVISRWIFKKFVIYQIKPIFQIVFSRTIKTRELEDSLLKQHNILAVVRSELSVWAEYNQMEIERLKEIEKYRRDFLGNVAHEMKTPIFNIQGYIATLLGGGLEDPEINRKYLERSEYSIDRLINIVTDLDEISRLESSVHKLKIEQFDVAALTREIIEELEMEAGKKNIRMYIASAAHPVMVRADRYYIERVLMNLIINAIHYGRQNGFVKISFIDMLDKVIVEVSDNGMGIAKDDIPRVFERFFRADKSRSRENGGTGLGLSIVKHVIEAHRENITVRSAVGRGSTFSFTLSK